MSEEEFNAIFARRLKFYLEQNGITQFDLSKRLHVSSSTVTDWVYGRRTPRMDKVDAMCEIFNCSREDLITEKSSKQYYDEATAAMAQEILDNEDFRLLMEAAKNTDPELIKETYKYLLYLKNRELHLDD